MIRRRAAAGWGFAAAVLLLAGCAAAPKKADAPAPGSAPGTATQPESGRKVSPYAPAKEDPSTRGDYVAGGLYKPGVRDTLPDYLPDVDAIPEPEVVAEARSRSGNRSPYTVLGKSYRVLDDAGGFVEQGLASYYGQKFHGRKTSNQEVYDMYAFTAAHKSLPLPSFARVTNLDTGKSVVVRVNDRGPFHEGRVIDLSYAAAVKIGVHPRGTGRVEVRALSPAENARDTRDTRVAVQVDPATGLPPGVRVATGKPQPAQPSAIDGLVQALPATSAAATARPSATAATAPAAGGTTSAPPAAGGDDWRFDMRQDGKAMSADEFDAWMKARRARVATGRAGTPDPYGSAAAAAPAKADAAPSPTPAAAARADAGGVLLQVAAFGSRDNAQRALAMLERAGIAAVRLHDGTAAGKPVWRLRVGPVANASVAELSARVAGLGFGAPHVVRE
ncbi:septal ring lytic transglycosylase RlpA family protein [Luteimonas sp. MC1572]|uniref:septal ring lytic transglycosylase RlpA family protein n=1 Tax=Luteimonas sp. MC1572 TaxID=2799325 RepID=UPI0018F093CA|nr:septal ring lytic transglycosylase RlpA family protein [Luteimonas sp. MC1572]MBJ6981607.1 septal ring lytic transglycosylase RlpA family protein [Luteimonas sp. MC1572]QQO02904.1 septal ring lytic transglycosylase RlpA family protein [Luteimonas sp. MC1572]